MKSLYWIFFTSLQLCCAGAAAEELAVLKNGSVADATQLNNNFAYLNNRISETTMGSSNERYQWLGYTSAPYDLARYGRADPITLTLHCKDHFGPSAFVATDIAISDILARGGDFAYPDGGDAFWIQSPYPNYNGTFGKLMGFFETNSSLADDLVYTIGTSSDMIAKPVLCAELER